MRASEAVIDVQGGRVVGVRSKNASTSPGFGDLSAADRQLLLLKMQGVVYAIRNGFYAAQGRLNVLSVTSKIPTAALYEVVRSILPDFIGQRLPVGAAPEEVVKNVSNALKTLQRSFETLVIPAMEEVKAGKLPPDRWFAMTRPYIDGIKSILDEIGESSLGSLVVKSAQDFIDQAKSIGVKMPDVGNKLLDVLPLILGVMGLLLVAQVTAPLRALSGTSPKRLRGYARRTRR